jgi:hypothetical protein
MSWLISEAMMDAYGNSPFLPERGVGYSEDISLDGEQSAPLSGSPTQQAYCAPDKMTKFSRLSRYGMTFKPLTDDRGEELLTLYLAAFHAKTSAPQERGQESTESDPGCGHIWQELLARYDQSTSLWRTPQSSLLGDYTEFSETWPRWGSMQNGVSYRRQTLVPLTSEIESGLLLPTPDTVNRDNKKVLFNKNAPSQSGRSLATYARTFPTPTTWPTPRSNDAEKRGDFDEMNPRNGLPGAVKRWPTPRAFMHKDSTTDRGKHNLGEVVGGTLNPTWVEWLMGWPLGWTDLKPLATDKFRSWQQQHGVSSSEET